MSDTPPLRGCPDPSLLARFAAGTLDADTRAEIELHIADCAECPVVIGETVRFLHAEVNAEKAEAEAEPAPAPRWWLLVAAVAALCVPAVVWNLFIDGDPIQRIHRLASESPERRVEGRLAEVGHAPFERDRAKRKASRDTRFLAEAERLAESARTDPRSLHGQGIAFLLAGDADRAVDVLTAATRVEPQNAALWNDLSVAYLELATFGRSADFEKALAATDEALRLDPSMTAAHFNRAVVLQHLGRKDAAVAGFRKVIALEPDSRWVAEATERLSILQ